MGIGVMSGTEIKSFLLRNLPNLGGKNNEPTGSFPVDVKTYPGPLGKEGRNQRNRVFMAEQRKDKLNVQFFKGERA